MTSSGGADPGPDLLSGGDSRSTARRTTLTLGVVGAVAVGAVLLGRAGPGHDSAGPAAAATDAPTSVAQPPWKSPGSVFLEHLPQCTRTDHHHVLTVAFGVSNLGPGPLVLLGASPLTSEDDVLRLTDVRLGADACGARGGNRPLRLAPSDAAVVAMTFRVSPRCPHDSLVAARVTFDAGAAGLVHSDSSALTDLSRLEFDQC